MVTGFTCGIFVAPCFTSASRVSFEAFASILTYLRPRRGARAKRHMSYTCTRMSQPARQRLAGHGWQRRGAHLEKLTLFTSSQSFISSFIASSTTSCQATANGRKRQHTTVLAPSGGGRLRCACDGEVMQTCALALPSRW